MILLNQLERRNEYENCDRYKCLDFWCIFRRISKKILSAVVGQRITACATTEIINEYEEIVQEMINRKQGHINRAILSPLIRTALYIVSGDKDLLVIEKFENIQIVTAKIFLKNTLIREINHSGQGYSPAQM